MAGTIPRPGLEGACAGSETDTFADEMRGGNWWPWYLALFQDETNVDIVAWKEVYGAVLEECGV